MHAILIIGGYGVFGSRIARLLSQSAEFKLLIAGRSLEKAEAFCRSLADPAAQPVVLDRNLDLAAMLQQLRPWLVIDATGPFQGMTDDDYRIASACIRAGIHYLDIADARIFVEGFCKLDDLAKQHRVVAITGASSVPALTSAIVSHLGRDLAPIHDIEIALSASNRATVGTNVIRAILSYVGKPIPLWQQAAETAGYGWQSLQRRDFHVAGRPSIRNRLVGLCDVPDLRLLPQHFRNCRSVVFRAGAEMTMQNLLLWLLSWPVRWGWIGSLAPLADVFGALQRHMGFLGSDRSAFDVRVTGRAQDGMIERRYSLIADGGDGPWIPCLAAALLSRHLAKQDDAGEAMSYGAYPAIDVLPLADFEQAFGAFQIATEQTEQRVTPLYAGILQSGWDRLPAAIRDIHDTSRHHAAEGRAAVTRGDSLIATIANAIFGFPAAGDDIPVRVDFLPEGHQETWQRRFGAHRFSSCLSAGTGTGDLTERFGALAFDFALVAIQNRLEMHFRGWRLWGIPLPRFLAPHIHAVETAEGGVFQFDVRITLPFGLPLLRYRGTLTPVA